MLERQVLMAGICSGVSADELVSTRPLFQLKATKSSLKAPEVAKLWKVEKISVASNYTAPVTVTEQPVAPVNKAAGFRKWPFRSGYRRMDWVLETLPSNTGS